MNLDEIHISSERGEIHTLTEDEKLVSVERFDTYEMLKRKFKSRERMSKVTGKKYIVEVKFYE